MAEKKKDEMEADVKTQDQAQTAEATEPKKDQETDAKAEPKKAKEPKEPKSTNIYNAEYYDITLPLTEEQQDDVIVIINGMSTQIKRGEPVRVSASVYEVLKNQERMDSLAFKRSKALSDKAKF